jgi:hypothetical protein
MLGRMDDLTDEERAAVIAAVRKALADDPFPRAPRLEPLRSALAKLDPSRRCRGLCRPSRHRQRLLRAAAAGGGRGGDPLIKHVCTGTHIVQAAYYGSMVPRLDWLIAALAVVALIATAVWLADAARPVSLFAPRPVRLEAH